LGSKAADLTTGDAEFAEVGNGELSTTSIYTPIDPVRILPDVNVFMDRTEVTMSTATPQTTIHIYA
jgi:hypothetical protein